MTGSKLFIVGLLLAKCLCQEYNREAFLKPPSVFLSIISRNEEHTLPTYLGYIEKLDYPKDRISILIQTDHNEDDTAHVLKTWKENVEKGYHNIILRHEAQPKNYSNAKGPNQWTSERYHNLLKLKQNALDEARKQWADYIFFVDGDNFITESRTLKILINEKKAIIAPMLRLFQGKSAYSNFWGGVDERGYYKRVDSYFEILRWEKLGTFAVPMVHSTYLIELRNNKTDNLQFFPVVSSYENEVDDILVFAHTARNLGLDMNICNRITFGYMLNTCTESMSLEDKRVMYVDTIVDYMAYSDPLIRSPNAPYKFPEPTYAGFDEIFMINLKRRTDRYERMALTLKELGYKWKHFEAVDGKKFSQDKVDSLGIVAMNDFKDPYLERPLTFGEIGCFMSHYYIWQEMVERNLETVLVLEDDVRFEFDFNRELKDVMKQADQISSVVNWDLIYLGRKHMSRAKEHLVKGASKIVWARYSYWTLGYVLRLSGAKKLLAGDPLPKMVPVDEYIPIMFDDHPDEWLLKRFPNRNLVGLSADPLLMYPTHYVGDEGYISDTEDTLSFEGESVEHFRKKKEEEKKKNSQKKKNGEKSPKTQSDEIKPKIDPNDKTVVADANKASHGEL
eukprot:TCONS_00028618-protein